MIALNIINTSRRIFAITLAIFLRFSGTFLKQEFCNSCRNGYVELEVKSKQYVATKAGNANQRMGRGVLRRQLFCDWPPLDSVLCCCHANTTSLHTVY